MFIARWDVETALVSIQACVAYQNNVGMNAARGGITVASKACMRFSAQICKRLMGVNVQCSVCSTCCGL